MKRILFIMTMVVTVMLISSCKATTEKTTNTSSTTTNISVVEAAKNPDKFKGKRVSWSGKPMVEIKAGDSQPMIVIEPGYIVIPKMSKPIDAYREGAKLLVEGVYDGVGGELGTFAAGGNPMGGAKLLIVRDATVTPLP